MSPPSPTAATETSAMEKYQVTTFMRFTVKLEKSYFVTDGSNKHSGALAHTFNSILQ